MHRWLIEYFNKNISVDIEIKYQQISIREFYDKIVNEISIENKEFAVGIFLDLSKAFDIVNYKILLKKTLFE